MPIHIRKINTWTHTRIPIDIAVGDVISLIGALRIRGGEHHCLAQHLHVNALKCEELIDKRKWGGDDDQYTRTQAHKHIST